LCDVGAVVVGGVSVGVVGGGVVVGGGPGVVDGVVVAVLCCVLRVAV